MRRLLLISILVAGFIPTFAQKDVLKQIVEQAFNSETAHNRIFFNYLGVGEKPHVLPSGLYAFIVLPNESFLSNYPKAEKELSRSFKDFGWLFSIPFILDKKQTIIISSITKIAGDPNIEQFIIFDKISISKRNAKIEFHSSGIKWKDQGPVKYFQFEFLLKLERGTWIVKESHATEIKCCDKRFDKYL